VWLNPWIDTITNLLLVSLPIYFLVSLKTIYQQRWRKTIFKFLLIGFCYIFILVFGLVMMLTIGLMSL
jgi:succinate dehydrogenase hydrophobic anchor subunit